MYYFAYGSNMNWPQMQRRCPSARFVCIARLIDYQFGITRHSRLRDCGTANVIPAPGKEVWGIIYDVNDDELLLLDSFEDGYRRETLMVRSDVGEPLTALVYIAELEHNVPLPSAEYKQLIVEGAKHWRVPNAYLATLEAITITPGLERSASPVPTEAKLSDEPA
jgi:gamma-glutamylcyclotransferase (GGCT)/AIG2-like uncharacterized protein YtfP